MLNSRLLTLLTIILGLALFLPGEATAFPSQSTGFNSNKDSDLILQIRHRHDGGGYGYPQYWRHHNYGYQQHWRHSDYGYPRYWRRSWNYGYYPRCGYWNDWCSSYYGGGYWYGGYYDPWYYGPTFGTTFVFTTRHHHHGRNRHEKWCANRYRSYNASTDTWVAYSGKVRRCVSPYRN